MTFIMWLITLLFFAASIHITLFALAQLHLMYLSQKRATKQSPIFNKQEAPFVTIQLPVYNEPLVVENLIKHIIQLAYPADKLEIQILDDSTDETTTIIKNTLAVINSPIPITHIRRDNRAGYKAGALKHATEFAKGEFIAIFDADFRPEKDFLTKTIPYFQNEKIGAVQTRWGHLNEDYSILTRIQAILINNHYITEQNGRRSGNLFLQFNGTAGVWRKEAILTSGNWQADTLIEDLDLSYRAQLAGWEIEFLNEVVCPAELPATVAALKIQQFRWMQGGAEAGKKHLRNVWLSNFNLVKKLHATMHLTAVYVFISMLVTAFLSVPMIYITSALGIPIYLLAVFSVGLLVNGVVFFNANYRTAWIQLPPMERVLKFIAAFPLLLLYCMGLGFHNTVAIRRGFLGIHTPFNRTPKFNLKKGSKASSFAIKKSKEGFSFICLMEGGLVLYFLIGMVYGVYSNNLTFLSYNFLLVIAYTLIFMQSINLHKIFHIKERLSNVFALVLKTFF